MVLSDIFRFAGILDKNKEEKKQSFSTEEQPEQSPENGKLIIQNPDHIRPAPPAIPQLGLALGGGAARGWAHIGVLKVLIREGLRPAVIAGTSIGAVVGGCYAAGKLEELESFARALTKRRILSLMDFHFNSSGLLGGERLQKLLHEHLGALQIEELPIRFATVATELGSGHEVWLTRGQLTDALRASYALPGVFDASCIKGRWLMDGALVNPIPVTTARVLGAEAIVAVNLNGDPRARVAAPNTPSSEDHASQEDLSSLEKNARRGLFAPLQNPLPAPENSQPNSSKPPRSPGLVTVLMDAFNITQDRIARSRLAGDPPDVTISPRLARIGLFDFHRASETIEIGEIATERALPDIIEYLQETRATL